MASNGKHKAVRFQLEAPGAKAVSVAGTFNGWSASSHPMKLGNDGAWRAAVRLDPGRYEYKYVVDGVWCCGFGADGPRDTAVCGVANDRGTMNCVIEVSR